MQIRLGDEDRTRLGIDTEWLEFEPLDVSLADLDELSRRFAFDPWDEQDPWPVPFWGALTLEQAGQPGAKPKPPRWQRHAAIWMALRQNGHKVGWDEAGTVRIFRTAIRSSPGKEPAEAESVPSTTAPSESSSD